MPGLSKQRDHGTRELGGVVENERVVAVGPHGDYAELCFLSPYRGWGVAEQRAERGGASVASHSFCVRCQQIELVLDWR